MILLIRFFFVNTGILATSRAMGDYPLKENNLVIAEPDILTFELADHK